MNDTIKRIKHFGAVGVVNLGLVLTVGACGGDDAVDVGQFPGEAPPPCDVERQSFVVDSVALPDGEKVRLNDTHELLRRAFDHDNRLALSTLFARGEVSWIVHVETCEGYARVILEDDAGRESVIPAVGTVEGDLITVSDGTALIPAPTMFALDPAAESLWVPGGGLALTLSVDGDRLVGTMRGGVAVDGLEPVHQSVIDTANALYAADGGCPNECLTRAARGITGFDDNADHMIDRAEYEDVGVALFRPDLDLLVDDEAYVPGADGKDDHVAFVVDFTAVRAGAL